MVKKLNVFKRINIKKEEVYVFHKSIVEILSYVQNLFIEKKLTI